MRRFATLALAAGFVLGFHRASEAHVGGIVIPIYELSTSDLPDLTDGSLSDWEDVLGPATLTQNDFTATNVADGAAIDPADLAYRIWLAWHSADQTIWSGIERVDDVYINTYAGGDYLNMWQYDGVEFMLDGDHSGGQYNGFDANAVGADQAKLLSDYQAQQNFALPSSPDGRTVGYEGNANGWATLPPYADGGGGESGQAPTTTVMEFFFTPWDALDYNGPAQSTRSTLAAGRFIGIQIAMPDFDTEAGTYHGYQNLNGEADTWRLAENFADGQLIPCDTGDCGSAPTQTAVAEDSWGRIKAAFK
jgi:hypothetical protein